MIPVPPAAAKRKAAEAAFLFSKPRLAQKRRVAPSV